MADKALRKRYNLRNDEALLARVVAFAEGPVATAPQKQTVRLLQDVLQVGPIIYTGFPTIASWTPTDFADFQHTLQTFFRRLMYIAESGSDEAVQVPELKVQHLQFGVTVRTDVAFTVEGHAAADVLTFQIIHLAQRVG